MITIANVSDSVLDLIGHTPLVDVSTLSPNPEVRILAKLESQNPFGSVKDRIAKAMIEDAEKHGHLTPGQTIVEPSSGNTGIALAAIARIKGYPIKILLPENVSIERRQMLEVFGAEIILTPGAEGSTIVWPGRSRPSFSACSIIALAMRSFTEPNGFCISSLARIRTFGFGDKVEISTSGVLPIRSSTLSWTLAMVSMSCLSRNGRAPRRGI